MPVGDTPAVSGGPDAQHAPTPGATPQQLWALARDISPRPRCRIDTLDHAAGEWRHDYRDARLPADPGNRPTALYLTDAPPAGTGRFRLLAFDLDVARGDVEPDLHRLRQLLDQSGIPHVVAASGPSGGRHVWCNAGTTGADPALIARIARSLAGRLPTLDIAPLTNPVTGAVRPPGAPHRAGGHSTLLDPATAPQARDRLRGDTSDGLARLATLLELAPAIQQHHPADGPDRQAAPHTVLVDGGPALSGPPRPLPRAVADQLAATSTTEDTSAALARVLVGLALARWTWPMVLQLMSEPTAAGLEHARSRRPPAGRQRGSGPARLPRPAWEATELLRRQWQRAVTYASRLPELPVDRDAVDEDHLVAHVASVQASADQVPDRWARPSGPADRGVLDALCQTALTCGATAIDLDVRRAATIAGVSPATAARALRRLALDGWIRLALAAEGRRAARWQLLPPGQSQPDETQAPHPPLTRSSLLTRLLAHSEIRGADLFAPCRAGGLGRHAARTAIATLTPRTLAEVAAKTGYTATVVRKHLHLLRRTGVAGTSRRRWKLDPHRLVRAARRLGVHGYRSAQARSLAVDRELWAWWHEELQWMHADRRWRRPAAGQAVLLPLHGQPQRPPFPRRTDGRADYPAARATVLATYGAPPAGHLSAAA